MARRSRTQPWFMLSIALGNLIQLGGLLSGLGLVARAARAQPPWKRHPTSEVRELVRLNPRRSTAGPPKTPAKTAANAITPPVRPVLAALPVVCKTNQGSATKDMALPIQESAVAPNNAKIGNRRTGLACWGPSTKSYRITFGGGGVTDDEHVSSPNT